MDDDWLYEGKSVYFRGRKKVWKKKKKCTQHKRYQIKFTEKWLGKFCLCDVHRGLLNVLKGFDNGGSASGT